jgi:RHS repeat-associated protein
VRKTGQDTTYYFYDGEGRVLGEYDRNGNAIQETVYLNDMPVVVFKQDQGNTVPYYIYADHTNTPRVITHASDNAMVWRWDTADSFGATAPDQKPTGMAAFGYNPRFPGQMFDSESGFHYNYFRDYDPKTGRYLTSDPIGMNGGVNTYAYVQGNPVSNTDPLGLRTLSPSETLFLRAHFGKCLDSLMPKFDVQVRTIGDTSRAISLNGGLISFPKRYFIDGNPDSPLDLSSPNIASIFGHESLHQLQRANGVSVTGRGIGLQLGYSFGLFDPYSYKEIADPTAMLDTFKNGNPERQGQMFQEYLKRYMTGQDGSNFQLIGDYVKNNCGCDK